ncbi:hypothetical protein MNV49_000575 [Pseudohyphozyma bogoriensis]|nr:hypothetical protein MNV49_000575 [Pseudohyphozyma bogoriensis]
MSIASTTQSQGEARPDWAQTNVVGAVMGHVAAEARRELDDFVAGARAVYKVHNQHRFLQYYARFFVISSYLKRKGHLDKVDEAAAFVRGLPTPFRVLLEATLQRKGLLAATSTLAEARVPSAGGCKVWMQLLEDADRLQQARAKPTTGLVDDAGSRRRAESGQHLQVPRINRSTGRISTPAIVVTPPAIESTVHAAPAPVPAPRGRAPPPPSTAAHRRRTAQHQERAREAAVLKYRKYLIEIAKVASRHPRYLQALRRHLLPPAAVRIAAIHAQPQAGVPRLRLASLSIHENRNPQEERMDVDAAPDLPVGNPPAYTEIAPRLYVAPHPDHEERLPSYAEVAAIKQRELIALQQQGGSQRVTRLARNVAANVDAARQHAQEVARQARLERNRVGLEQGLAGLPMVQESSREQALNVIRQLQAGLETNMLVHGSLSYLAAARLTAARAEATTALLVAQDLARVVGPGHVVFTQAWERVGAAFQQLASLRFQA